MKIKEKLTFENFVKLTDTLSEHKVFKISFITAYGALCFGSLIYLYFFF